MLIGGVSQTWLRTQLFTLIAPPFQALVFYVLQKLTGRLAACVQGIVRLKNMWKKGEGDEKGDTVRREELVSVLRQQIAALGSGDALLSKQAT